MPSGLAGDAVAAGRAQSLVAGLLMRRTVEGIRRLLEGAGAHLRPCGDGYDLYLSRDGRRRPADRLSEADLSALLALGPLSRDGEGRLCVQAQAAPAAHPRPEPDTSLIRLIRRQVFSRPQLLAFDQWRRDSEMALGGASLTLDWARLGGGSRTTRQTDVPLSRIQARRRYEAAEEALGDLAPLARRVGLEGWGLAAAERASRLIPGRGEAALGLAFDRLMRVYRIGS
ncbi:MAG: DUF6456 domain-containing protein [Asticcacaulis sp.]